MGMTKLVRSARFALLLAVPFGMTACGSGLPATTPAAGTVTVDGKPLAKGQVMFLPVAGPTDTSPAASGLVENGAFSLNTLGVRDGIVPGKYKVSVFSYEETRLKNGATVTRSVIPDRYANADTSGILLEIPAGGSPALKIELTGQAKSKSGTPARSGRVALRGAR